MIAGLLGVILLGFAYNAVRAGVDPGGAGRRAWCRPSPAWTACCWPTGILGATVMPHVIYLHSALTKTAVRRRRRPGRRRDGCCAASASTRCVALGAAGLVNLAMLVIAAQLFFGAGMPATDTLEGIHAGLGLTLDGYAALAFAARAAGLRLRLVQRRHVRRAGRHAGLHRPAASRCTLRRLLTMAPAMAVLVLGVDPTAALVWSQVVLSFGVPFALDPAGLADPAPRRDGRTRQPAAPPRPPPTSSPALIIALNVFLIVRTFTV